MEGHWECEKHAVMLRCLCKSLSIQEGATHFQNGEFEIRADIKYFCKKGMPPKKIHEDIMETLGKESHSYSTVKQWAAEFKRRRESVKDDRRSDRPKDAATDENVRSCIPCLCVIGGETCKV